MKKRELLATVFASVVGAGLTGVGVQKGLQADTLLPKDQSCIRSDAACPPEILPQKRAWKKKDREAEATLIPGLFLLFGVLAVNTVAKMLANEDKKLEVEGSRPRERLSRGQMRAR